MKKNISWNEAILRAKIEKEVLRKYHIKEDDSVAIPYIHSLKRFISIPIVLGTIAIILYLFMFGKGDLLKTLLEWIIGVTIVATIVAYIAPRKR